MKALLALLVLLTAWPCVGQVRRRVLGRRAGAVSWVDPSGSNTLYAWWHYTDLTVKGYVNDTNPWVDRVKGIKLQQRLTDLAECPTNDAGNSLFFASDYLTNAPLAIAPGVNSTFAFIFAPTSTNLGGSLMVICSTNYQKTSPFNGLYIANAGKLQWPALTAINAICITNRVYDVVGFQDNTTMTWNTNGVACATSATLMGYLNMIGWDNTADPTFIGYFYDVMVWSNKFSATQLANLHNWAKSQYPSIDP